VAPGVVIEIHVDVVLVLEPATYPLDISIQLLPGVVTAIGIPVMPANVNEAGRQRFGHMCVSPIGKAQRNSVFAKQLENGRNLPAGIAKLDDAPNVLPADIRLERLQKYRQPFQVEFELWRQLK
jgi:hypothetical protein